VDKQIKELLGSDGFAAYQAYDKNILNERRSAGRPDLRNNWLAAWN